MTHTCAYQPRWSWRRCGRPITSGVLYGNGALVVSCVEHLGVKLDQPPTRLLHGEALEAEISCRALAAMMPLECGRRGGGDLQVGGVVEHGGRRVAAIDSSSHLARAPPCTRPASDSVRGRASVFGR